jgi:Family of unknown function (DUF5681)
MSKSKAKDQATQDKLPAPDTTINNGAKKDRHVVGYGRPPVYSRFKRGQSGNPKGRPKGRRNILSELSEIAAKRIVVRDGETERRVSLAAANLYAHGVKGAKGDARSSSLFFSRMDKMGLLDSENEQSAEHGAWGDQPAGVAPTQRPSDSLFESLNPNLLSREEQLELSRLAELIELGGDFTALTTGAFERVKYLVNKGRGKDITP